MSKTQKDEEHSLQKKSISSGIGFVKLWHLKSATYVISGIYLKCLYPRCHNLICGILSLSAGIVCHKLLQQFLTSFNATQMPQNTLTIINTQKCICGIKKCQIVGFRKCHKLCHYHGCHKMSVAFFKRRT